MYVLVAHTVSTIHAVASLDVFDKYGPKRRFKKKERHNDCLVR